MPTTVTVLDPSGTPRDIPTDQLQSALAAGGKQAVKMADPKGVSRWVSSDQVDAAKAAGGTLVDAPDTRSLWQKAKDNFNANTQGAKPGDGAIKSFIEDVGAGGGDVIRALAHPINTLSSMASGDPEFSMAAAAMGDDVSRQKLLSTQYPSAARTIGQIGTGAIIGEAASGVAGKAAEAVKAAPDAYRTARSNVIGGSNLNEVINGDTVTPLQRYEAAKAQGVNLDTAQATNAPVATQIKRVTEHSLGGSSKFEANNAANVQALQGYSQKLLDTASPVDMSREDFGNTVKARLLQDQQNLNETSADLYKKLDADIGASVPDSTAIRDIAQKIVDQNKTYYAAHPELLSGGAGKAWRIVNNLADSAEAAPAKTVTSPILDSTGAKITTEVPGAAAHQDTWSDLHKLRSDLLDITRGPEIIGDRPTGWIKQLTGAVDDTMTKAAYADSSSDFRDANEIYKHMKQTYDDPTSRLYSVVRSPDGLTAANTLANITPEVARKISGAAPELVPQLQRQTMSRILNPTGNDLPDLKNLASRLNRAQKEQLAGVLTPEQIKSLDDLGRTAKLVTFDSNPSGSGKVAQKAAEAGVIGSGLMRAGTGLVTGNPAAVVEGAAPLAYTGAQRLAASKFTNPEFTDAVMNPPLKGQALWAKQGAAKLSESGLSAKDIDALSATTKGISLLVRASGLSAGSPAMKDLVRQIKQ